MFIYFRVCELQNTISYVNRYNSYSKLEIIEKCWLSIQQSVSNTDTIILVADDITTELLEWLLNTCNTKNIEVVFVAKHEWSYHQHTVTLVDVLEKYSKLFPDQLHYIVEDDYLHLPNAIPILQKTLENWPYFATSYDYPDRYFLDVVDSKIILGPDRHWRTVNSTTMTLLAKGSTWLSIMPELKEAAPTSNDKIFENIFKNTPCISPLPGLSSHMTDRHLTPLINWEEVWDNV